LKRFAGYISAFWRPISGQAEDRRASPSRRCGAPRPDPRRPPLTAPRYPFGPSRLARRLALGAALALSPGLSAGAESPPVRIEGVPAALEGAVSGFLAGEKAAPESSFEASRQARRAVEYLGKLLESEGYYEARFLSEVEPYPPYSARVNVSPGPLFTFAAPVIAFSRPLNREGPDLSALLASVAAGAPARAEPALALAARLTRELAAAGYPDARMTGIDALADAQGDTLSITYEIDPGAFSRFGSIRPQTSLRTRDSYLRALSPFRQGDPFNADDLALYRRRLSDTGLFSQVEAEAAPERDGSGEMRDILLTLNERERRTVSIGASYSTSDGSGLETGWQQRNLTGRGDTLDLRGQIADREDRVGVSYTAPNTGRFGRDLRTAIDLSDKRTDAFNQTAITFSGDIREPLDENLLGAIGAELSYAETEDDRTRLSGSEPRATWTVSGAAELNLVTTDAILDPRQGVRARLRAEPGVSFGESIIALTRISAETMGYLSSENGRMTLALRSRLGALIGPPGAPPDKLFFAGGGGSVRGFGYQSLSPVDGAGRPTGGRSLVEAGLELRLRTQSRVGYALFLEAGAAGSDPEPPFGKMRAGIGAGVRYDAGFGPLRADIAIPLKRERGEETFQLYISIGQAY